MTTSVSHWDARIQTAMDLESRRSLIAEISMWRATRLSDVPAQREAAFALSRVYHALGDESSAIREGQSWWSLCQSPPEASDDETRTAAGWMRTLGVKMAPVRSFREGPRLERPEPRSPRPVRMEEERRERIEEDRRDPFEFAVEAARSRRWGPALDALKHLNGPKAEVVRAYVVLARAAGEVDGVKKAVAIADLEAHLARVLFERIEDRRLSHEEENRVNTPRVRNDAPKEMVKGGPAATRLAELLGGVLPDERSERMAAVEAAIGKVDLDTLAAAVLLHHVEAEGVRSPAPWWISLIARALAMTEGHAVREAITTLGDAFSVTAYSEPAFRAAVEVLRGAGDAEFAMLRRGVLTRGEPREQRVWTLRLRFEDGEKQLALVGGFPEGYRVDTAARIVERLIELCPTTVVVALGEGLEVLMQAAERRELPVIHDDTMAALIALRQQPIRETSAAESRLTPADALKAAVLEGADVKQMVAQLVRFGKVGRALVVAGDVLTSLSPEEADARLATLIEAAAQVLPVGIRPSEAVSLALRVGARLPESKALAALEHSSLGGPNIPELAAIAKAAILDGFALDRAWRGSTGRERRDDAVLDALGDAADPIWRLIGNFQEREVEIWFITSLPPEAKAALTRWLLHNIPRVVVAPIGGDVLQAYADLNGPEAVGWTGPESAQDVVDELRRLK